MNIKESLTPEKMSILLIKEKKTFADIGRIYNTSRQRIHQIYNEYKTLDLQKSEEKQLFKDFKRIPTKEEIQKKIEEHYTYSQLCNEYNISFLKLKKILNGYKLEKKFIKNELTKEILIDLFIHKNLTDKEISEIYDCSDNTVKKLRQDNDVIKRKRR